MATKKVDKAGKRKKPVEKVAEKKTQFQLSRINEFASDVKNEFGKVVWPDKKHTLASTGVVVVFVILISFYLGAVDLILGKLIGYILN